LAAVRQKDVAPKKGDPGAPVDKVIFPGDHTDKCPDPAKVMDAVMNLPREKVCLAGHREEPRLHFTRLPAEAREEKLTFLKYWSDKQGAGTVKSIAFGKKMEPDRQLIKKVVMPPVRRI
jgi:hypothetical protein